MFCYFAAAVRTYAVIIESLRRFVIYLFIFIYLFKRCTIQDYKSVFKSLTKACTHTELHELYVVNANCR